MRKEFNVRLRVPDHLGSEIHSLALKESRSDSAMISLLVTEALSARRTAASHVNEVSRLASVLRGEGDQ
jgi:hypothetical protein